MKLNVFFHVTLPSSRASTALVLFLLFDTRPSIIYSKPHHPLIPSFDPTNPQYPLNLTQQSFLQSSLHPKSMAPPATPLPPRKYAIHELLAMRLTLKHVCCPIKKFTIDAWEHRIIKIYAANPVKVSSLLCFSVFVLTTSSGFGRLTARQQPAPPGCTVHPSASAEPPDPSAQPAERSPERQPA
jgi:hypothetical protein